MLTSKQRAYLRSMAAMQDTIFQVGKGGITDNMCEQIANALEARELIKCTVQDTAPHTAREACQILCEKLGAQPVQCIGRKFSIYRRNDKEPKIEF